MAKGRSKDLIRRRNVKLLRRYYELTEIERLRFDDTTKKLSEEEFFISESVVTDIIRNFYRKEDFEEKHENR